MSQFKSTHCLRISNRGDSVETIVQTHSFSVNLPPALRSLGKSCISVYTSLLNHPSDNSMDDDIEFFVTSNILIGQSIDTETYTGGFEGQIYNKLVTYQADIRVSFNRFRPNVFLQFDCSSIPEKIQWAIWKRGGDGSTIAPIGGSNNYYDFITLKIEVYK